MERIESPSFFFSLPFHLLLIFVSSQRGATNLSIHFFPQTSLSKRRITKNYTQNWFSRIKTTPILVSCLVVPPYTPILLSNPVTRLSSPSTSRRDDKNCEILHEPAKPYLSTRMRNERERKRELKSFPPTTWVAKPLELPLRSLSLLNKTLGETHSPSANSESPTSKSFSRIVESSISGDPRIHRQLDVKGGCKGSARPYRARVFYVVRRVGFYTSSLHAVFRAHAVGNDGARESQREDEQRGRRGERAKKGY